MAKSRVNQANDPDAALSGTLERRGSVMVGGSMPSRDAGTGPQAASAAVQKNSRMPQAAASDLPPQAGPTASTGMVASYAAGVKQGRITAKDRSKVT